tara:strand:- start:81 stop:1316 length:1236 start_codon:yes stop_codon:yes gene_type:complete
MKRLAKPAGWPKGMKPKVLRDGSVAYYWSPAPRHLKDCPIAAEALGKDYAAAKARCDVTLNPLYIAWRNGEEAPSAPADLPGTFKWLVASYQKSPRYARLSDKARRDYDKGLAWIEKHVRKDGLTFGDFKITDITPAAADRLYEKFCYRANGEARIPAANAAMRYARRAWNVMHREQPALVPAQNPFAKMGLIATDGGNEAATRTHLEIFAKQCDLEDRPMMAAAAYLSFDWLQREVDIIGAINWTLYRPGDRPDSMKIRHHKTGAWFWTPLDAWDADAGEWVQLYPELEARLTGLTRHGALMVMRDQIDARKGQRLPWSEHTFRHEVREVMDRAGLSRAITFTSFRHGGMTELGDSGLTDSQIMSLSAHKDAQTVQTYNKKTTVKREMAALTRLRQRTARAAAGAKRKQE